jgi:hypothetical protein
MDPKQHRERAQQLRQWNPRSRAAELHDLAATAIEKKNSATVANTSSAHAEAYEGQINAATEKQRRDKNTNDATRLFNVPTDRSKASAEAVAIRGATVRRETMKGQAKSPRTSAGYIYILKPRISLDGQEVIKIGMTTRTVAERVRELTTGSMVSFEVVYSLQVENARSFEKHLHA